MTKVLRDILACMTLDTLIILFGTLTGLVAFSGFPPEWKDWIVLALGVIVVILGVVARRRLNKLARKTKAVRARRKDIVESAPEIVVDESDVTVSGVDSSVSREERTEND